MCVKKIINDKWIKIEKSRDIYKSRYLTLHHKFLTQLCLMTLFTKIKFLFNQIIWKCFQIMFFFLNIVDINTSK